MAPLDSLTVDSQSQPLAEAAKHIREAREDVDRLVGGLRELSERIHAISGPITAAALSADLAGSYLRKTEGGELAGNLREAMERVRRSIEEMRELVRRVRLSGASPVAVTAVLQALVADWRGASERQVSLVVDPRLPPTCHVPGGEGSMRTALGALLANSVEGRDGRGATRIDILVSFDPVACHLDVVVQDNGPGFSENQLGRGLQPLTTGKPGHSGLGLLDCWRIAQLSGGSLSIGNRPEGGATVRIQLGVCSGS